MPESSDPTPVLQVRGLHFAHPGQPPLFDGLAFALPAGLCRLDTEVGKTTLLRLIAGALHGRGDYLLNGARWEPAAAPAAACWIDPRDPAWDAMTPAEVMAAVRRRHPALDAGAWQRHAEGFGLAEHLGKTMHMLSTGSRRKVALASALSAGAALTLLDEPTAGLDKPSIEWLAQALCEQAGEPRRAWLLAAAWGLEDRLPWAAVLDPLRD